MMTYEYDASTSVIHLRASGILIASDPITYFRQIDEDPDFKPKAEERIYFNDLEDIAFSYTDVKAIRGSFERYKHGEKISKGVFIVDSEFTYGMARMVTSIFEIVFKDFTIERID